MKNSAVESIMSLLDKVSYISDVLEQQALVPKGYYLFSPMELTQGKIAGDWLLFLPYENEIIVFEYVQKDDQIMYRQPSRIARETDLKKLEKLLAFKQDELNNLQKEIFETRKAFNDSVDRKKPDFQVTIEEYNIRVDRANKRGFVNEALLIIAPENMCSKSIYTSLLHLLSDEGKITKDQLVPYYELFKD